MIPLRRPLLLIGTYYCVTSLSQRPQQSKFQQSTKSTTKQPAKQWTGKRRKREKRTNGPTYPPIRRTFSKVSDAAADHRTWKPLSMSRSHWIALVLILTKVWYVKCLIDNQVVAQAFLEQINADISNAKSINHNGRRYKRNALLPNGSRFTWCQNPYRDIGLCLPAGECKATRGVTIGSCQFLHERWVSTFPVLIQKEIWKLRVRIHFQQFQRSLLSTSSMFNSRGKRTSAGSYFGGKKAAWN